MDSLSKTDAAIFQLTDAIRLYDEQRFISAITLAAAAEEVLGQMLKLKSTESNIPMHTAIETETFLFDQFKDFLGIENYKAYRKKVSNELKHHGQKNNHDIIKDNFKKIALNHIAGALTNYKLLFGNLPQNKTIIAFCSEVGFS